MSHTYVIAEAGSTHDGSLDMALELVQIAKDAGADACKFQWASSGVKLAERRHIMEGNPYALLQYPESWLQDLLIQCSKVGIDFMCTAYLPEDIKTLSSMVSKFKVASFEALDTNFILDHLEHAGGRDIIVSTGMMNAKETHRLLGLRDLIPEIKLLHCVSAYPAPAESLNLGAIREMGLDGFSDHTNMLEMGSYAVAAGAKIIEVHFRHEGTHAENPDYGHSLSPGALNAYVGDIRFVEIILGDGVKGPREAEREMARYRVQR